MNLRRHAWRYPLTVFLVWMSWHAHAQLLRPGIAQQAASLPGVRVIRDVSYGSDLRQRFDVYAPAGGDHAPVIFLVHGGAWAFGDKAARNVVENKVARWVLRGFVVISTNYRMLPQAGPATQAEDLAHALAAAQQRAREWGADSAKFILMGHSSGAHLVALLSTDKGIVTRNGDTPWLGTISLDSAALDVVQIMQAGHFPLYDRAFGKQPADWVAASPYQQMHGRIAPFLSVCSSRRMNSCPQAEAFVSKAVGFGSHASVLREDLSHEEINERLGADADYTSQVEAFMRSLDPTVARLLPK